MSGTKKNREMRFDLRAFKARVSAYCDSSGQKHATLSKRLFTRAATLPDIMDADIPDEEKTFPRLDTLVRADERLKALERAAGLAAEQT